MLQSIVITDLLGSAISRHLYLYSPTPHFYLSMSFSSSHFFQQTIHPPIHPSIHNQSNNHILPIHFSLFTASFVSTSIVRLFTYSIVSSTRTPNSLSSSGTSSLPSNYASLPPSTPTYKPGSTQNETPAASGVLQLIVGVSMLSSPM